MIRRRVIGSGTVSRQLRITDLPDLTEPIANNQPSIGITDILNSVKKTTNQRGFVYVSKDGGNTYSVDVPAPLIAVPASFVSYNTATITQGYNKEVSGYFDLIDTTQASYNQKTWQFMDAKIAEAQLEGKVLTNSKLRYKGNWQAVKDFVAREELMKIKVGVAPDLEMDKSEIAAIRKQLENLDLTDMKDSNVQKMIDNIWQKGYDREYLNALKEYRDTGRVSKYLQKGKLDALAEELKNTDLDRLTSKQYKHLRDNYIEQMEGDHETSVNADPRKQSTFNNVRIKKTSVHDESHTDENGKIKYDKPKYGKELDRRRQIEKRNTERVLQKQVVGLAAAVGIAAGIGFSLGFVSTLAQSGVSPETLRYAFVTGAKTGIESGIFGGVGYVVGQTVGKMLSENLASAIATAIGENIAPKVMENISRMCAMGVVGGLMIVVTSVYQFVKLKMAGYSTKECLIRVGKNALVSMLILALSIAAQGIWGGYWGLIISISASVLLVTANVVTSVHDRKVRERIAIKSVEYYIPDFAIVNAV